MEQNANVVTKDQLIEKFHAVASETEQLLKLGATAGGEQAGAMRARAEKGLANVRDQLRDLQNTATDRLEAVAGTTDEYVHEHPWQAMGVAAGLTAVVAGVAIGLLLNRR